MITWIASYPKSGNTMLRSMLAAYLFTKDGNFNFNLLNNIKQFPNPALFDNLGINSKDHNEVIKNSIKAQETFYKKESYGFIKTHNMLYNFEKKYPFTDLNNTLGAIYIVRDPRNIVHSYARHLDISIKETVKFITKGKSNNIFLMGNWSENYLSWKVLSKYKKYLLIKYENLTLKREETFLKILKFIHDLRNINFIIDKNKLKNVLKTTSFDYLKNLELERGFEEGMKDKEGNKIPFFDKGKKRNWSQAIDKDFILEIEKYFYKEMHELEYL